MPRGASADADDAWTFAEKQALGRDIGRLEGESLHSVVDIVRRREPGVVRKDGLSGDWDFDLNVLADDTLDGIGRFVRRELRRQQGLPWIFHLVFV